MNNVFVLADNIFSPLGKNTRENMDALKQGRSGIRQHLSALSPDPFYASLFPNDEHHSDESLSFFEQIVLESAVDAIQHAQINPAGKKTGFILSTTKGNISLIEKLTGEFIPEEKISLNTSACLIAKKSGINTDPIVVSHACICLLYTSPSPRD